MEERELLRTFQYNHETYHIFKVHKGDPLNYTVILTDSEKNTMIETDSELSFDAYKDIVELKDTSYQYGYNDGVKKMKESISDILRNA